MTVTILQGDARATLATLPSDSVQCIVTSPPYFGLRDYGCDGQIGLEDTPEAFVTALVGVFREARRVLRSDGVCWLNLGDSYAGSWGAQGKRVTPEQAGWKNSIQNHPKRARKAGSIKTDGVKAKDLYGIPWMVAFALRSDGWWLRRDVIWEKPRPMPESTTDRPTTSHEYVFLLTKSETYFYDHEAIKEPSVSDHSSGNGFKRSERRSFQNADGTSRGSDKPWTDVGGTRNARSVWRIDSSPFAGAHFATMPIGLAERCILAGTSAAGCCPSCGAPWDRIVEEGEADLDRQRAAGGDAHGAYAGTSTKGHDAAGVQNASDVKRRILAGMVHKRTVGWEPTCDCPEHEPVPCTVLDPFGGAGTTGLAAQKLRRDAVLIELSAKFAAMARARVDGERYVDQDNQVTPDALPLFSPVAAEQEAWR